MSALLVIVVALATYFDLKERRIPNWLIYPAIFSTLIYFEPFFFLVFGSALLAAILFGKYVGAGDIKLCIVVGLWSHILSWSQYWIFLALIAGGIFGLINRRENLPFAPFIAAGIVLANLARSYGFI